jgi:hypothetical protein
MKNTKKHQSFGETRVQDSEAVAKRLPIHHAGMGFEVPSDWAHSVWALEISDQR